MADTKASALTEVSVPALEDLLYTVDDPSGTPLSHKVTAARAVGNWLPSICEGRLTLETGVPVSTTDQIAKTTIYFTPYQGNRIALYDGTRWKLYAIGEPSLALGTLTSGKNYDIWLYDNAGTLTLELSAAWTNDTTRADALTTQDGIKLKSGATTRRYLGTFRTTATTTTEDSLLKRFVWNLSNQVPRQLIVQDTTDTWTYSTNAYRQTRASSANQAEFVIGLAGSMVWAVTMANAYNSGGSAFIISGVGLDSTTATSSQMYGVQTPAANQALQTSSVALLQPGIGYHYLAWLERINTFGSGTGTWYGDAGLPGEVQCGLVAWMHG